MVQSLRLSASSAGHAGLITGQGTKSSHAALCYPKKGKQRWTGLHTVLPVGEGKSGYVNGAVNWRESESCSIVSDCLLPDGLLQATVLEWVAYPFSRGSS